MQSAAQSPQPARIEPDRPLGRDNPPLVAGGQNTVFFISPLIAQRLVVLKNMVARGNQVIIITGEGGSGKTTLMNHFVANAASYWHAGHIRLKSRQPIPSDAVRHLNNRMVFVSKSNNRPSVILDDAHQLTPQEIKALLQWAFAPDSDHKLHSIVLLAEPQIRQRFTEIAKWLPPGSVIDKIHMTPLTEKQTADYLRHRAKMYGPLKGGAFSKDQVRTIYQLSNGLPGCINHEADKLIKQMKGAFSFDIAARCRNILLPLKTKLKDKLSVFPIY